MHQYVFYISNLSHKYYSRRLTVWHVQQYTVTYHEWASEFVCDVHLGWVELFLWNVELGEECLQHTETVSWNILVQLVPVSLGKKHTHIVPETTNLTVIF